MPDHAAPVDIGGETGIQEGRKVLSISKPYSTVKVVLKLFVHMKGTQLSI